MEKQMEKNQLKQAENQNQQGRSMVEMLGVLAIIGVLSIGAIRGYRWAMDKHMANQVLYEMNLNSAQLAMLLQKGNSHGITLSLGSPYDDNKTFKTIDYGFEYGCGDGTSLGHECQNQNETVYYIKATGIPEKVCNILDEAVFSMPYYYDSEINGDKGVCQAEDNTVAVLFDVNYSNKDEADSDSEVATTTLKPTRPPQTVPVSTVATTLTTQSPTTATNAATTLTTQSPTTATYATTATAITTTVATLPSECRTNADCQIFGNYYCYFPYSSSCREQNYYRGGTCEPITPDGTITINKKTFIVKEEYMSWWSAQNFCHANGKELANISDLDCTNAIPEIISGYCYQEDGKTISSTVTALQEKFGKNSYWSYWLYELSDSCSAYTVYTHDGRVLPDIRYELDTNGYHAALCE